MKQILFFEKKESTSPLQLSYKNENLKITFDDRLKIQQSIAESFLETILTDKEPKKLAVDCNLEWKELSKKITDIFVRSIDIGI